jgi:ankyrin repeat protein
LENIEFEHECIDKCKKFLWNAAHSPEQDALTLVEKMFKQALEQTGKMVLLLDGLDEISPDYSSKVERLIKEIRDKTSSKIWISSRFSHRQDLEEIVVKQAFTLQPFTLENKIEFLEQYWNEVINTSKQRRLRNFAKTLLSLCSQNISDKDGEFTGIPLQIKMLGEAFVKEAEEYCSSGKVNLPEKFNLLDLFRKFTEYKFNIYFSEKNAMDSSKPETKRGKKTYFEKHMISALISLFSLNEVDGLLRDRKHDLEQAQEFLRGGRAQQFGIISDITDGKPKFIHRCFAEYFAAKWFTANFGKCKDLISNTLFNSTYEVARNIFYRMFAEEYEMRGVVLNNDTDAVKEFLKQGTKVNNTDKDSRTALHMAASYNSPVIQKLPTFPGADANKPDAFLIWTPLRYADKTKSCFAMDILLQNGANADDIVLARRNIKAKEWGQTALWESASKGHRKLLELIMDFEIDVNGVVKVPENLNAKITLLHRATFCGQLEVIRLLVERKVGINIRNANKDTALRFAAESGSVDIIQLLVDKGMSVNLINTRGDTPLHVSARRGNLEATKNLAEKSAALNTTNVGGNTPLMEAAYDGKSEVLRYLTEVGPDTNIHNKRDKGAIHIAVLSGSVDIIKYLIDQGISVDFTNPHDDTPLHVSARCGTLDVTKNLVERGAALNSIDDNGNTSLMEGAYEGKSEVFRYVTEVGADTNVRNKTDKSALHIATLSGSVDINKYLLDKGMSVKFTDKNGITPLHVSAANGSLETKKPWVERRAVLNSANVNGDTQLMLVVYGSNIEQMGVDIKLLLLLFCALLYILLLLCVVNASFFNIYCTSVHLTNETQNFHLCFNCNCSN